MQQIEVDDGFELFHQSRFRIENRDLSGRDFRFEFLAQNVFERVGHVFIGGAAQRIEEFVAVIFGRIVRRGNHNAGRQLAAARRPGDGGRGRIAVGQKDRNAVRSQNIGGGAGEFGAEKARVVADGDAVTHQLFLVFEEVSREGGREQTDVFKGVIFGDDGAPAVGAKTNIGGHRFELLGENRAEIKVEFYEGKRSFWDWDKGNRAAQIDGLAKRAKSRWENGIRGVEDEHRAKHR